MSDTAWSEIASAVLRNEHVELHPVAEADRELLRKIALDERIWTYFVARVENDADFDDFFDTMLADQAAHKRAVYVIVDNRTGQAAGSSSYGNLAEADRRLEIGWSWLGPGFQGQDINRWAKYLLLQHAFETMGAMRVEFKTDVLNAQARQGSARSAPVRRECCAAITSCPPGAEGTPFTTPSSPRNGHR